MSAESDQAIAALEEYLRRYPSGNFAEMAQIRLDRLLAQRGERKIQAVSSSDNPFSKGTLYPDLDYRVGDRYEFTMVDGYTGLPLRRSPQVERVTAVTDFEVIYNRGRNITDLLGNTLLRRDGRRLTAVQNFPAEYTLGRKWTSHFEWTARDGDSGVVTLDFAIVGRETVTIPVGRFEAFRVEGWGEDAAGHRRHFKYWAAPDRVRRPLILERSRWRLRGQPDRDRRELVAYFEASRSKS